MDMAKLHHWVNAYNWDDGLAPIWPIAESPCTEFATALLIYWRLGGPWLQPSVDGVNAEASRLSELVKTKLLSGCYRIGTLRYDPKDELSAVQLYNLRKSGFPELLLGPSSHA